MSTAEQIAETVVDSGFPEEIIAEQLDGVVDVVEVVKNNPIVLAAVGVAGLIAGAAGGYFVAYKRLSARFAEDLETEIEETRRFYAQVHKVDEDGSELSPMDVAEKAGLAVRKYQGRVDEGPTFESIEEAKEAQGSPADEEMDENQAKRLERILAERGVEVVEQEDAQVSNVFSDSSWDYEVEKELRTPEEPYIITHDEYFANDPDHDQSSLTWFEKDETLVDEHDKPMEGYEELIGGDHLLRFGSGSKNSNVVYVRNEKTEQDWEISRSSGSYLEEVLSLPMDEPDTLKHSNRNAQQRRRREFRHGE